MKRRQYGQYRPGHHAPRPRRGMRRLILITAAIVLGLFVVANAGLWVAYQNRTYPGTRIVNTSVGNVTFSQLAKKVSDLKLLPQTVQLQYGSQKKTVSLAELGVQESANRAADSARAQRSWLPILNLLSRPQLKAPVALDNTLLAKKAKELAATFHQGPTNARLALNGTTASIKSQENGWDLDQTKLGDSVLGALDHGQTSATVAVQTVEPKLTTNSLKPALQDLQQQLATVVTFSYNGRSKATTAADVASWMAQTPAGTYELSAVDIGNYMVGIGQSFGIHVKNIDQVVTAVSSSVKAHKSNTMALAQQVALKTYHYCTNVRGVDASNLTALRAKLASTYSDIRGWNLGGLVDFVPATSGCDFTVWLSAASQMPTFGAICDSSWSCEAGNNTVVINYDRWTSGTGSWNAAHPGGDIEGYRDMAINHETGHQLGFGHSVCGGTGQLSPVMQQESINLHGCVFNAWPLPGELTMAKQMLGL